jgi:choline-glycine betaine transporter
MESKIKEKKHLRMGVFLPAVIFIGAAALLGIISNKALADTAWAFFHWSLESFGWLYQIASIVGLVVVFIIMFSKLGNIRIGGKDAKPKYSMGTWFAMTLTGGVATGIVTWGVNEPLIYFGNVWGELNGLGIEAFSNEALRFALGRSFYNWTFIPYAMYALTGLATAYVYYNKKDRLAVTSTLKPLFGERIANGIWADIVDTLSMLAIALGLTSGLTMCITLVTSGLHYSYGIEKTFPLFLVVGIMIIFFYTFSSYIGLDKGMKKIASLNAYFYYGLLILLIIVGQKLFMVRTATAGMAEWLDNFWLWGLDPIDIGGAPLTQSWTLFDWACWIAYAPVTGIFLAMISHGRTIREFLLVNLILPSVFGIVWFTVWGGSALGMQVAGTADLVGTIVNNDAISALWQFIESLPFGLGTIVVPLNLFIIVVSFVTCADATSTDIASMCLKDVPIGTEPPATLKVLWGGLIGIIAIIMAAFGGQEQGVEGVKALATAGGFVVLFIYVLQIISVIKMFFVDKIEE